MDEHLQLGCLPFLNISGHFYGDDGIKIWILGVWKSQDGFMDFGEKSTIFPTICARVQTPIISI